MFHRNIFAKHQKLLHWVLCLTQLLLDPIAVLSTACNPDPCLNGGTCSALNNGTDYACQCTDSWTGDICGRRSFLPHLPLKFTWVADSVVPDWCLDQLAIVVIFGVNVLAYSDWPVSLSWVKHWLYTCINFFFKIWSVIQGYLGRW